ncbi:hypothetical protein [Sinorhizobium alkalisoli]|uniref:hypothetical protein n=1 Tax=Sinorhizobium alkalisoli TaxID=1752398 RepID=UPI00124D04B3|nr:hypothetical protein [Sinorhizobium alkalisoli]MCG5480948.1 hypothetical protein [Sinorhizobium alkalisoli]QFI70074.1 ABC transport system, permease component YbhR [Sinorhizobium alkalisoli]
MALVAARLCRWRLYGRQAETATSPDVSQGIATIELFSSPTLKDLPLAEVARQTAPLCLISVVTLSAAAWLFRRRLE